MEQENLILELVKYGVSGIVVILMIISLRMISAEQKKAEIRENFIRVLRIYLGVSGALIVTMVVMEVISTQSEIDRAVLKGCQDSVDDLDIKLEGEDVDPVAVAEKTQELCQPLWAALDDRG